jgi:CDP-paratose 2-epimerase
MKIVITGGLGFIGVNSSIFFSKNNEVHIIDNFSRKGNIVNYELISGKKNINIHIKDIRNFNEVSELLNKIRPDVIIHLAGQVAVTSSIINPREDFEINLLGTFNILENIRLFNQDCFLIFSSTNKVYGDYKSDIVEYDKKYDYSKSKGVNEETILDFHSPYGCSKGSADQYVRDYSRIYGVKSVVLRQSCVYGTNQFGIEDQGWIAWFTIASFFGKQFTIYGNGKQVRDILYIDDLVDLYNVLINNINICSGEIYNVGGGYDNSFSLLNLIDILEEKTRIPLKYNFSEWRHGDQKIYISDIHKLKKNLNWYPKIGKEEGINRLFEWVNNNTDTIEKLNLI